MSLASARLLLLVFCVHAASVGAAEVRIAVAANFTAAMKEIAEGFKAGTGHSSRISFGSTGKLYAQILHGAPFDVFLAADQDRPRRLVEAGLADRPFTYAVGKLVLWSADTDLIDDGAAFLGAGDFKRLAIANPKTAPYGLAALEVIRALGLEPAIRPKLVRGDSIAQTHQFVATRNAEIGFVAKAQIVLDGSGSNWPVPQALYTPIRQDAVVLGKARDDPAARALVAYLRSQQVRGVIEKYGYSVVQDPD